MLDRLRVLTWWGCLGLPSRAPLRSCLLLLLLMRPQLLPPGQADRLLLTLRAVLVGQPGLLGQTRPNLPQDQSRASEQQICWYGRGWLHMTCMVYAWCLHVRGQRCMHVWGLSPRTMCLLRLPSSPSIFLESVCPQ